MSVLEAKAVDGIAMTNDDKGIVLLITDHLGWENEYQHLKILQKKINAYISFWETEQYKEIYTDKIISYGIIELRFIEKIPQSAIKYLQVVQKQVGKLGIRIKYLISKVNEYET